MCNSFFALIRHGEYKQKKDVPSALQPYPLTDDGIKQAAGAAATINKFAREFQLTVHPTIDCSPLLRAWQTARVIAENIDADLAGSSKTINTETYPALVERSVGSLANLTVHEIEQVIEHDPRLPSPPKDWKSNSHYQLPFLGAESLMQAGERVKQHVIHQIQTLTALQSNQGQLKLFVGHGASIRHAAHLMGIIEFEQIAQLSMHHAHPIFFEINGNKFKHVSGEWKQRQRNASSAPQEYTD